MKHLFIKLRDRFRILKNDLPVLWLALRDARTPISTKLMIGLTIFYFFSPIDLVPDFIPVVGIIDDLFMVPFLVSMAVKTVPYAVLMDAKSRLSKTKSTLKTTLLIIIVLVVIAAAAFYGYQYFNGNSMDF